MEKVAIINELYFDEKKTLTEIADIINTSVSYISEKMKNIMKKKKNERMKN